MCSARCVLALVALHVGLAHSWDIAVSVKDQLIFYINGTKTDTVNLISQNPTALVYDEIHNMMLYVDKQKHNDAVCGYDLSSKDNKCFIKRNGRDIHGLAFDPVTEMIFFTDKNERSINWVSLKPGCNNNIYGNLLIKMDSGTPTDITVDICRGYIYWTYADGKLERAQFNGSERKVMSTSGSYKKFSIFIDPQSQKIFYFDVCETCTNWKGFLNSNNLNLKYERVILGSFYGPLSPSKVLTVSKDYFYWMNNSDSYGYVWKLAKNTAKDVEPEGISELYNEKILGITAKYNIEDQIKGIQDCASLSSLIPTVKVATGKGNDERCVVSACENYCLHGNCSVYDEGRPKCRCNAGYSGERCEVNLCSNFCLNDGVCFLNEEEEPDCQCVGNYEGSRCEAEVTADVKNTTTKYDLAKRNFSVAEFLSTLRKPSSKVYLTVEV